LLHNSIDRETAAAEPTTSVTADHHLALNAAGACRALRSGFASGCRERSLARLCQPLPRPD